MLTGQEKAIGVIECDEQIICHPVHAKLTVWLTANGAQFKLTDRHCINRWLGLLATSQWLTKRLTIWLSLCNTN